jgi:hypothetical protein
LGNYNYDQYNCGASPGGASAWFNVNTNDYYNYGGGGTNSSGQCVSDTSPQHVDP